MRHHLHRGSFLIAGVGALALPSAGCSSETAPGPTETTGDLMAVETLRVNVEQVVEKRTLTGDITPWEVVPLSFKLPGQVTVLNVDEGDRVTAGQHIAILDSKDYRLMRDLAGAQVTALEPHLNRAKTLRDEDALATAEVEKLQSKMKIARIQRSQARSQLADSRLVSPVDGVVIRRMSAPGYLTSPEHPIVVVAIMDKVKAVFPVSQSDLSVFREGLEVTVSGRGISQTFTGKLHSVALVADEHTRTFPVTFEVPNPEWVLKGGMIVEAEVVIREIQGIFVPLQALTKDVQGRPTALCVTGSPPTAQHCPVVLGHVVGDRVEVVSGLIPGQQIVVKGLVSPGDQVRIRPDKQAPEATDP